MRTIILPIGKLGQNRVLRIWKSGLPLDWNSLMEVVENVMNMNLEVTGKLLRKGLIGIINIETTYEAVFRIYKMYNSKKIRIMGNYKLI
jgi:hypothetical protein